MAMFFDPEFITELDRNINLAVPGEGEGISTLMDVAQTSIFIWPDYWPRRSNLNLDPALEIITQELLDSVSRNTGQASDMIESGWDRLSWNDIHWYRGIF